MAGTSAFYNWKVSSDLWVALVHAKPTEKLSVIRKIGDITKAMLSGQTEHVQREVNSFLLHFSLFLPYVVPIRNQQQSAYFITGVR